MTKINLNLENLKQGTLTKTYKKGKLDIYLTEEGKIQYNLYNPEGELIEGAILEKLSPIAKKFDTRGYELVVEEKEEEQPAPIEEPAPEKVKPVEKKLKKKADKVQKQGGLTLQDVVDEVYSKYPALEPKMKKIRRILRDQKMNLGKEQHRWFITEEQRDVLVDLLSAVAEKEASKNV